MVKVYSFSYGRGSSVPYACSFVGWDEESSVQPGGRRKRRGKPTPKTQQSSAVDFGEDLVDEEDEIVNQLLGPNFDTGEDDEVD